MDIKQFVKWSLAALVVLAFQYADANPAGELPDDIYREKYENTSEMPNHLAYLALMQNLRVAREESGADANVAHVRTHLTSLDEAEASRFLNLVLSSYEEMVETNRTVTNRMLCRGGKPKYETNRAYAVLDVIDDIKETNLRKHYQRMVVDLGENTGAQLNAWLDVIKSGSSHHKYDHARAFEHTNQSVEDVISTACNILASYFPERAVH